MAPGGVDVLTVWLGSGLNEANGTVKKWPITDFSGIPGFSYKNLTVAKLNTQLATTQTVHFCSALSLA